VKDKQTIGSTFFGAFPSDRMPKATKNVISYFFIHSNNYCKLQQRIPANYTSEFRELFEATKRFTAKQECFIYILKSFTWKHPEHSSD